MSVEKILWNKGEIAFNKISVDYLANKGEGKFLNYTWILFDIKIRGRGFFGFCSGAGENLWNSLQKMLINSKSHLDFTMIQKYISVKI